MPARALDHVNIITHDMEGTAAFYERLLGLRIGDGPPPNTRDDMIWMFDASDRPIVHINKVGLSNTLDRHSKPEATSGAIHHVAFDCDGYDDVLGIIKADGLAYRENLVEAIGLRQLFIVDPNGVLLELNFRGE